MSLESQLDLKYPIYWNDWAIEEKFAKLLIYKIVTNRPKNIVELGSGLSTLLMAKTISSLGYDFFLHSFDSDKLFLKETKNLLMAEGLYNENSIKLKHSEIKKIEKKGLGYSWYNPDDFNFNFDCVDLLIVDGPVGSFCKNARYPAFPVLKKYLRKGSIVLLDDANREDEKEIIELWKQENPEISKIFYVNTDRGAVEMRF